MPCSDRTAHNKLTFNFIGNYSVIISLFLSFAIFLKTIFRLKNLNELIKIDMLVSSALDLKPDIERVARAENYVEDGKIDSRRD